MRRSGCRLVRPEVKGRALLLWVWSNQVVSMINDGLLAFGLLLSTATQLRLPGTPWGAGEALLTIWIIGALADLAHRGAPALTRPLSHMLLFWAVFTFAQSIGLFWDWPQTISIHRASCTPDKLTPS